MPTKEVIESTMKNHFESWNSKDKDRWIANWDENVVMYDPVGGPDKQGIAALEDTWENSFKDGHSWKIEPVSIGLMMLVKSIKYKHISAHLKAEL